MVKTENECCDCGLPCVYESCPYWAVTRFYCDECNDEYESIYHFEGEQLCIDCIEKRLEKVEYNE
jgi:hypothetical protein